MKKIYTLLSNHFLLTLRAPRRWVALLTLLLLVATVLAACGQPPLREGDGRSEQYFKIPHR